VNTGYATIAQRALIFEDPISFVAAIEAHIQQTNCYFAGLYTSNSQSWNSPIVIKVGLNPIIRDAQHLHLLGLSEAAPLNSLIHLTGYHTFHRIGTRKHADLPPLGLITTSHHRVLYLLVY